MAAPSFLQTTRYQVTIQKVGPDSQFKKHFSSFLLSFLLSLNLKIFPLPGSSGKPSYSTYIPSPILFSLFALPLLLPRSFSLIPSSNCLLRAPLCMHVSNRIPLTHVNVCLNHPFIAGLHKHAINFDSGSLHMIAAPLYVHEMCVLNKEHY